MVNTEIRLIMFFAARDGEALYSQQKQGWELTGSDHEFVIAKFRLKFKKAGKTTKPSRYPIRCLSLILKLPVWQQPLQTGSLGDG